ncbi:MAG: protein kinase [Planctomycetes bacterium]|nr:protein kinase [Planctomycetota bacterium]
MELPDELKKQRTADLFAEFMERRNRGEAVDPQELLLSHPDLADELAGALSGLRVLDQMLAQSGLPGPGDVVGDFHIDREIGRGGSSVVYEATQLSMGRRVALKILPRGALPPERLRREVETAGRLHHPYIVPLLATGQGDGFFWITMVLADGGTLATALQRARTVPPAERGAEHLLAKEVPRAESGDPRAYFRRAAEIAAAIADALQYAHERGILHRDVKPSNVVFSEDGAPRLVDFGLATRLDADRITGAGELLGTPAYLPPEVAEGAEHAPSNLSDVYSLGATLYEMLVLEHPFKAKTTRALLAAVVAKDPPPPRRILGFIPRDLETITLKCLEKQPEKRYASAGELAGDLRRFLAGDPILARPPGRAARALRVARRNPLATAFFLLSAGLILLLGAILVEKSLDVQRSRSLAYRSEMENAASCVEALSERVAQWRDLQARLAAARARRARSGVTAEDDTLYWRTEAEAPILQAEVESLARQAERSLERARTMTDLAAGTDYEAAWADLYLARWRWAAAAGDELAERRFRALALRHDDGSRRGEITAPGRVTLAAPSSSIAAYLHRYTDQFRVHSSGDMRLVPLPCDRTGRFLLDVDEQRALPDLTSARPGWLPGDPVLEVAQVLTPASGLRAGDWIVEVEGAAAGLGTFAAAACPGLAALDCVLAVDGRRVELAEQVSVLALRACERDGGKDLEVEVASGGARAVPAAVLRDASLRRFDELLAAGLPRAARCAVLRARERLELSLPPGPAGVVLAREGYALRRDPESLVLPGESLLLDAGSYLLWVVDQARPEAPALRLPFVVAAGEERALALRLPGPEEVPEGFVVVEDGAGACFALQRDEVSMREYLEFLNAAGAGAAEAWIPADDERSLQLVARQDGVFRLLPGVPAQLDGPAVGVSLAGAEAYIDWWSERERARGRACGARLPSAGEFLLAAAGADGRALPCGNSFSYRFLDGKNSHFGAELFARRGAFLGDEAPCGARGLAGGAAEWLQGGTSRLGRTTAGRWNSDLEEKLDLGTFYAVPAAVRSAQQGFRMVVDLEG